MAHTLIIIFLNLHNIRFDINNKSYLNSDSCIMRIQATKPEECDLDIFVNDNQYWWS